jgi:hypothetical protein
MAAVTKSAKAGAAKAAAKKKSAAAEKTLPRAETLDVGRGDGCVVLTIDGKPVEVSVPAAARARRQLDRVLAEVG